MGLGVCCGADGAANSVSLANTIPAFQICPTFWPRAVGHAGGGGYFMLTNGVIVRFYSGLRTRHDPPVR